MMRVEAQEALQKSTFRWRPIGPAKLNLDYRSSKQQGGMQMTNSFPHHPPLRILRLKQLSERIGLARSTIYDRMNKNSQRYDPSFPRPIKLGAMAIGWIDSDVTIWLEHRISDVQRQLE